MFFYSLQLALGNDVHELIGKNWNISTIAEWRTSETFDNTGNAVLNNVSLRCTTTPSTTLFDQTTSSILLYTDIDTRIELMSVKRTGMFNAYDVDADAVSSYNAVKDADWPDIKSISDFKNLSTGILLELQEEFNFPNDITDKQQWFARCTRYMSTDNNGIIISNIDAAMTNKVSYTFLLQDVVKTKFKCVTDTLGLEHTQEVADHVDMWVALHPKYIQDMFYKDI